MIGLILGTSEGRKILSLLNKYTEDIFVSTATSYGGELLQESKFKAINTKPLTLEEMTAAFAENKIELLVDASHPYAQVVTQNSMEACRRLNIQYVRYERPAVADKFQGEIERVEDYKELKEKLSLIDGTILNTTGSNNIAEFIKMSLSNRIIHRVLPSVEVMKKCFDLGVKTEDIIAIKGPIGYELNCSFIRNYDAKAIILKDSGKQGGTEEKLKAAADIGIKAFIIERKASIDSNAFENEEKLVDYIVKYLNIYK
jgi:precorrin-6A/cobalt-precorrin-6A reductase